MAWRRIKCMSGKRKKYCCIHVRLVYLLAVTAIADIFLKRVQRDHGHSLLEGADPSNTKQQDLDHSSAEEADLLVTNQRDFDHVFSGVADFPVIKQQAYYSSAEDAEVAVIDQQVVDRSFAEGADLPAISLCLPTMSKDLYVDRGQRFIATLRSIREQTYPPVEVMLGVSETSDFEATIFNEKFSKHLGHIPLRISATSSRGSVGMNRNRAASLARGNVISFFDADGDLMHPQRLEYIAYAFQNFAADVVLHSFSEYPVPTLLRDVKLFPPKIMCQVNVARHESNLARLKVNLQEETQEWLLSDMHHGHLSISRDTFERKKFNEDFYGKEDSVYVNSAVELGDCFSARKSVFVQAPLTFNYVPRSLQRAYRCGKFSDRENWNTHLRKNLSDTECIGEVKPASLSFLRGLCDTAKELLRTNCESIVTIGGKGVNGRHICDVDRLHAANGCIVYSVGMRSDISFERDIVQKTNCTVHIFDCTVGIPEHRDIPRRVNFHDWCVGKRDEQVTSSAFEGVRQYFTLATIMKQLNHTSVDVLKFDVGHELDIIASLTPSYLPRQILFVTRLHNANAMWGRPMTSGEWEGMWCTLESLGYGIFSHRAKRCSYSSEWSLIFGQ